MVFILDFLSFFILIVIKNNNKKKKKKAIFIQSIGHMLPSLSDVIQGASIVSWWLIMDDLVKT